MNTSVTKNEQSLLDDTKENVIFYLLKSMFFILIIFNFQNREEDSILNECDIKSECDIDYESDQWIDEDDLSKVSNTEVDKIPEKALNVSFLLFF